MDRALDMYETLSKEEREAFSAQRNRRLQARPSRTDEAKQRLAAALEREEKRQNLVDADLAREAEERHEKYVKRRESMLAAEKMRVGGVPNRELLNTMRRRSLEEIQQKHNLAAQQERTELMEKKRVLFETMRVMQQEAEKRSVLRAMSPGGVAAAQKYTPLSDAENTLEAAKSLARQTVKSSAELEFATKRSLWKLVHNTKYESPSDVIHQALVDAHKTYSQVYRKTRAHRLRHKRYKDISQAYSGFESRCYSGGWRERGISTWGAQCFDDCQFG